MRIAAGALAWALGLAPLGAGAADLVVWWDEGFYPQEGEAVAEIIAAFEQDVGEQVELVYYSQAELPEAVAAAIDAGKPPDVAFGPWLSEYIPKWALDDRLVDLSETVGSLSISPPSGFCRRYRSCSSSHSGSTRAIRTVWPR